MQCLFMRRAIAPRLAAAIAAGLLCSVSVSAAQTPEPPAPLVADRVALTIDDAIRRAIDLSPSIRASAEGISVAEGGWRQAGVRPNPQLLIEAENFAGSGDFNGVSSSEFSYSLAQQIERGGKRRARRAVAGADREIANLNVKRTNLDIAFATQTAFIEAVTAKATADLARDRAAGFEETRRAVARRVEAAKDPRGAADSAAAAAAEARSDLARAERESVIAREQLSILTGLDAAQVILVAPWFTAPPVGAVGGPSLDASPDLAILKSVEARANANVALERATAKQDPTIALGVRNLRESRDTAAILSVSMPIALFNRNKGAIARAEAERRQAAFQREAAALDLSRAVVAARGVLDAAAAEAATLRKDVIPRAEQALASARNGYSRGAFTYLEVFSAQTALFDFRVKEVDALSRAHLARAEFDRLTARLDAPTVKEFSNE